MKNFFPADIWDRAAILSALFVSLALGIIVIFKYYHFGYYDWDLAFNAQAAWNLLHGSEYVSMVGIPYFGNHTYYIMYFILPLFALVQHPLTLVFCSIAAHGGTALLIYQFSKENLENKKAGLFLLLSYLIWPASVFAIIYEFNVETLAPLFLTAMFIFMRKDRFGSFLTAAFFALIIKENMALVVVSFGIFGLFFKNNKIKWGVIPLLVGLAAFFLMCQVLIPLELKQESHVFLKRYNHLGTTFNEIVFYAFRHPLHVLTMIVDPRNLGFLRDAMFPLLPLSFLSPQILLLALPILLQHLLSNHWAEHTIFYHYAAPLLPFIFFSGIHTLSKLKVKIPRLITDSCLIVFFLTCLQLFHFREDLVNRINPFKDPPRPKWQLISIIPQNASVVSTFEFLAPLSLRKNLYSLHVYYDESYQNAQRFRKSLLQGATFITLPENLEYALINFNDVWLQAQIAAQGPIVIERLQNIFLNPDWKAEKLSGESVLLRKDSHSSKDNLIIKTFSPLTALPDQPVSEKDGVVLLSFAKEEVADPDTILLKFQWFCRKLQPKDDYVRIDLIRGRQVMQSTVHKIGYSIFPTSFWKEKEYVNELFAVPLRDGLKINSFDRIAVSFTEGEK